MNDMENLNNLTSDEMEKMLQGVTNEQITGNVSISEVARKSGNSDSGGEEGEEEEEDPTTPASPKTDDPAPSPTEEKPKKQSNFAKVLAERNSLREKLKAYEEEKTGIKNDEEMDPYERDEKFVAATSKHAYVSEKLSDIDSNMEKAFYEEYPKAEQHKDHINAILQEHPELTLEDARKLYASRTNPLLLFDDQQINKMKGGDLDFVGTQSSRSTSTIKDPSKMSTTELENHLKDAVSQGVVV